jgi:hypothetical protein
MHTSVRYNRRIRKKLSEKTDEVVGKDSIGYRTTSINAHKRKIQSQNTEEVVGKDR